MTDTATLPDQIRAVVDALEEATEVYAAASSRAASSEADWKGGYARSIIRIAESALHGKTTTAVRDAYATTENLDALRAHLIDHAAADAAKQAIYSLRARLDALRTLNANARTLTDPRTPS